ncbi:MAG: STAS domain-containing protein [Leptospiraceae bacterium]|nr:STAS domain-containing protein [Leptospiraceae bacterium]
MRIESEKRGQVMVLKLQGRVDLENVSELLSAVRTHLAEGEKNFVLNMIDVTDISSTGIGRLLEISKEVQLVRGRLGLSDLSQVVEYVLDLARLSDIFEIFPNDKSAVEALSD